MASARPSRSGERRGKKQQKKLFKESNRPIRPEEEAGLLSSGAEDYNELTQSEMDPEQAQETLQRLQRKYFHKHEGEDEERVDGEKELSLMISPSKKREEEAEETEREAKSLKTQTRKLRSFNKENKSIVTPSRKKSEKKVTVSQKESKEIDEEEKSKGDAEGVTPNASTYLDSILTPDHKSTPYTKRGSITKRHSNFGFSRLVETLDSPDSSLKSSLQSPSHANINSFAFPSPSQSPSPKVTAGSTVAGATTKKGGAVKALTFSDVDSLTVDQKEKQKKHKGAKKKSKEHQSNEFDDLVESINREFREIEQYELIIDDSN